MLFFLCEQGHYATALKALSSSNVTTFIFDRNHIRVVSREGQPWFVVADVAKVLEIQNITDNQVKISH